MTDWLGDNDSLGVGLELRVSDCDKDGLCVRDCEGLNDWLGVSVVLDVCDSLAVLVWLPDTDWLADPDDVRVCVCDGELLCDALRDIVSLGVDDWLGECVWLPEDVALGVSVSDAVEDVLGDCVMLGVVDCDPVPVMEPLADWLGVDDSLADGDWLEVTT